MKVLLVADVLGEENNGTTIACMNLYRYLVEQGDDVKILCCDQDKKGKEQYYVVPTLNLGPIINKIVKKNSVSLAKPKNQIIMEALEGVDIVHIMMPFALGSKTAKIAYKMGIPITAGFHVQAENFTAHIQMMNLGIANHLTYKSFYKKLYKYVDAIHYPTKFIRDLFEKEIKKETNGYVISNGVHSIYQHQDIEKLSKTNNKFNILFIGRVSKEKSHKLLVKAVANSKYKNNIQLYFAGKGPREQEVLNYAKKLKIEAPVIEFMTRDKLVNLINSCDLYVHPAEIEIEAIACLEAISCGLVPVISNSKRSATKAFALSEKNLFKNNDAIDLAHKIDYWIEHPEEKEQVSKQYLGYAENFDQKTCMSAMRQMLLDNCSKVSNK